MHDGPWRVAPDLVWTRYDDSPDCAVFNPRSGDVHLLTESAHFLWQTIAAGPGISTTTLLDLLAARTGLAADGELSIAARDTLDFMDRAGLIVPDIQ